MRYAIVVLLLAGAADLTMSVERNMEVGRFA